MRSSEMAQEHEAGADDPSAVIVTDTGGTVVFWSRHAERLYGWNALETLGRHISFLVAEVVPEEAGRIIDQLARGEIDGWQGVFPLRRKGGSRVVVDAEDTPIAIDGVVTAILGESRAVPVVGSAPLEKALGAGISPRAVAGVAARWYQGLLERSGSAVTRAGLDEVLFDALAPLARSLGTDAISLLVADEQRTALTGRAALGWSAESEQEVSITSGQGHSGGVMSCRAPLIVLELDNARVAGSALRESGFHSYVGVALIASDHMVGVLHATSYEPDRFEDSHAATLVAMAPHLAATIDRVRRFEHEQEARHTAERVAEQLGAAISPGTLPDVEGLERLGRVAAALAGAEIESLSDERARAVSVGHRHHDLTPLASRAI